MISVFKTKNKFEKEYDSLSLFFENNFNYFYKIKFPIKIYPDLPSKPYFRSWQDQRVYILDNLIPQSFKMEHDKEYSKFVGERFEIVQINDNRNITKNDSLINCWLNSKKITYKTAEELKLSNHKLEDFNVFVQYFDYTPKDIFKATLNTVSTQCIDTTAVIKRYNGIERQEFLSNILTSIDNMEPFHHLDRIYDLSKNWELRQQEESCYLLVGSNFNINKIRNGLLNCSLEVSEIKNYHILS